MWGTVAGKNSSGVAPKTSYTIDNGKATVHTASVKSNIQYRQLFFQKKDLSPGPHILNMTLLVNGSTFWLDYINVTLASSRTTTTYALPTTGGPHNLETTATTTVFKTILLPDMSPEASSGLDQSTSTTKSNAASTAVVVGSILGGLSLLALIGALILWLVKKRRQRKTNICEHYFSAFSEFRNDKYSLVRNQAMANLYSNPFKKKEPTQNPFDYEYGQPMSTENPRMFFSNFATDELMLEPVRPYKSRPS